MDSPSLETAFSWANTAYLAGVAVAAVASFLLYFFGSRLATAKDAELNRFRTESSAAISAANARAAEAEQKAASLNDRAARIELQAAEQRERAAIAERQVLELRSSLGPRGLLKDDPYKRKREDVVRALSGFAGTPIIINRLGTTPGVASGWESEENIGIFSELAGIFSDAKWDVTASAVPLEPPVLGIVCTLPEKPQGSVDMAFKDVCIDRAQVTFRYEGDTFRITVGIKVPPAPGQAK